MARTQISLSVPEELKDDFYKAAVTLGTNPSNLLTMFMANVVHTREVHFRAPGAIVEMGTFSKSEMEELSSEGKAVYDTISNLVD